MEKTRQAKQEILDRGIPYRLDAVDALAKALRFKERLGDADPGALELKKGDGRLLVGGTANAILNPWIEVGVLYGRALLNFLGLGHSRGRITEWTARRQDDWTLEDFELPLVRPEQAFAAYRGPPEEAEDAFLCILRHADKTVGHLTAAPPIDEYADYHVAIACRGIRALVIGSLYRPLELPDPPRAWSTSGSRPAA